MDTQEHIVEELLRNTRAIGYLDRTKVDRRLRIVFETTTP
jgi:hypothetical protein